MQTTTTHLLWERTRLTCAYLDPPSVVSRNAGTCAGTCAVRRVLCSQRKRRAWHSTHRHTNRHLGATSWPVNDVWRLLVSVTRCCVRTSRQPALAGGPRSKSVVQAGLLDRARCRSSQSKTRIGDKMGAHLDAETARNVIISSRDSCTLTHELVGKEEASPDCRAHKPDQQKRQHRVVPLTDEKGVP